MFTDSDWAGEVESRKSTSGGVMQLGSHVLKTWASTQSVIALSTGEAEFYAIIKGASQAMGLRSMMNDLGWKANIRVLTDATTGKSIASRRGLGKLRHIDVSNLWIQEQVMKGAMSVIKVKNIHNSADIGTKHLPRQEMENCLEQMDFHFALGRSEVAPET